MNTLHYSIDIIKMRKLHNMQNMCVIKIRASHKPTYEQAKQTAYVFHTSSQLFAAYKKCNIPNKKPTYK